MPSVRLPDELLASWRERHSATGSEPRLANSFIRVETAWVLDSGIAQRIHPEMRRAAICMSSTRAEAGSRLLTSEGDLERWGVNAIAAARATGWKGYYHIWSATVGMLSDVSFIVDDGRREKKKRWLTARLAPAFRNRRSGKLPEMTDENLRKLGIPTASIPTELFTGDLLADMPTVDLLALVAVYALADPAFGGADSAHLRIEGGRLVMSPQLLAGVGFAADELCDALLRLIEAECVVAVPAVLRQVRLPGTVVTYEWEGDDDHAASSIFLLRPTVVFESETVGRPRHRMQAARLTHDCVNATWAADGRLSLQLTGAVPRVIQYGGGTNLVVADRISQCEKSQVRKAVASFVGSSWTSLCYRFACRDRVAIMHTAKLVTDALVEARVIENDTWTGLRDVRTELVDAGEDEREYIEIEAVDSDGETSALKVYVTPTEWRLPARRFHDTPTSMWESLDGYIEVLDSLAAGRHPLVHLTGVEDAHADIQVSGEDEYYDIDDVALFVMDLLTVALLGRDAELPIDRVLRSVRVRHVPGEAGVTVNLSKAVEVDRFGVSAFS